MPGLVPDDIAEEIRSLENKLADLRRDLFESKEANAASFDVLRFSVNALPYALRLEDVVEVLRMVKWQGLPKAPADVQGVVNCRGVMLPVLNLAAIVSLSPFQPTLSSSLIVVETSVQRLALVVEAVEGVATVTRAQVSDERAAQQVHRTLPRYVAGYVKVDDAVVTLLDVHEILSHDEHKNLSVAMRDRDEWGRA